MGKAISSRTLGITTLGAALLAMTAHPAAAQEQMGSVEGHAGVGFPAGAILDLQSAGPAFGLSGTYWLTDRVGVRAGGDVLLLSGKEAPDISNVNGISAVPDFTTFHYHGGLEVRVSPPEETAWDIRVNVGAGATSLTTEDFPPAATAPPGGSDFSSTSFSLNTGLRVGYAPSDRVNFFLLGQGLFALTDEEEMNVFTQFDENVEPNSMDSVWSVPLQGGMEVRF